MADNVRPNVRRNSDYGFWQLDPPPEPDELSKFYESRYYDLIRRGERNPKARRLIEGGASAVRERQWLSETLYTDIADILDKTAAGKRVLDVGCGVGDFLAFLAERRFEACGIEPSAEAAKLAQDRGFQVHAGTLAQYSQRADAINAFDAVVMLNVLEHVPDPVATITTARSLLRRRGILCVQVPNDFSEIQQVTAAALNRGPWWIVYPDHVSYFEFASIRDFLDKMGFDVVHQQGDFPMEFFLLMGDLYLGNPEVGATCHEKRRRFDLALPQDLRRRLYQALAEVGIGRNSLTFARVRERR